MMQSITQEVDGENPLSNTFLVQIKIVKLSHLYDT